MAVLDPDKNRMGHATEKSGTNFTATADKCLSLSLKMAGAKKEDIAFAISTGYRRKNVSFAQETKPKSAAMQRDAIFIILFPLLSLI